MELSFLIDVKGDITGTTKTKKKLTGEYKGRHCYTVKYYKIQSLNIF